jgi:uncharacterized protein (DUF362 family)
VLWRVYTSYDRHAVVKGAPMDVPIERSMNRAQVALAQVPGRREDEDALAQTIQEALHPLGGLRRYVPSGSKVLLKPNQTLFKLSLTGATTSPRLTRALVRLCFEAGAQEVWVAEAAGHAQMTRQVMEKTGMVQAIKGTGAHLIYLDEIAHKIFDFGEDAGDLRYMPAPEIMERADVIINLPKAKTHFVDPITCACKNWTGVIPMGYRIYLQRQVDPYYRGNAFYLRKFRPALNIVDGVIAGEGQGPGQNTPFWWGWVVASDDPVATDVTVCRLFGLEWEHLRMSKEAADLGVGVFDPEMIDILGAPFEEARVSVQPANPSVYRYPCRVIEGKGATIEGTVGHWKTIADSWLENNVWMLFTSRGTPTFMFGEAEDPDFEKNVAEGPYVVLDDSALDKYKYDPRVIYVPGCPVPQSYIQHEMVEGMGFGSLYQPGLRLYERASSLIGQLKGASGPAAQRKAVAKTLGVAAAATGVIMAIRMRGNSSPKKEPDPQPPETSGVFVKPKEL